MRFSEFNQRTDEIAPAAMAALRTAGNVAGGVAKAGAKVAVKGAQAAGRVGQKMGGVAKTAVQKKAQQLAVKSGQKAANTLLKKGQKVAVGDNQEVEIADVKGTEVTLADPKNKMGPKTVLQKTSPEVQNLIDKLTDA